MRSVARALAGAGHPAAAVDLYDGRYAGSLEEAFAIRGGLPAARVVEKLDDARSALRERTGPDARVGTLGFCMGGGYALLGACRRPFDFAVDYYGRIDRAEEVEGARGSVLLRLVSEDPRITPWALREFRPATTRLQQRVSVELYPRVRHAFHRPGGEGHDPAAAAHAWRRTLDFLAERERAQGGPGARGGILKYLGRSDGPHP